MMTNVLQLAAFSLQDCLPVLGAATSSLVATSYKITARTGRYQASPNLNMNNYYSQLAGAQQTERTPLRTGVPPSPQWVAKPHVPMDVAMQAPAGGQGDLQGQQDIAKVVSRLAALDDVTPDYVVDVLAASNCSFMCAAPTIIEQLKVQQAQLLADVAQAATRRLSSLTPKEIGKLTAAFAKLRCFDLDLVKATTAEVLSRFDQFEVGTLAKVVLAFSRLNYYHGRLLHAIANRAAREAQEASTETLGRTLTAFGRLSFKCDPEAVTAIKAAMARHLHAHPDPRGVAAAAAALHQLDDKDEEILSAITTYVTSHVADFHPAVLGRTLSNLGYLGTEDDAMWDTAATHVAQHIDTFSAEDLTLITTALAQVALHHPPYLHALEAALPALRPDLDPSHAGMLVEAGNQLEVLSPQFLELAAHVQSRGAWLSKAHH